MKIRIRAASVAAAAGALIAAAVLYTASVNAQGTQPILSEGFESGFENDPYCKQGDCKVPAGWGVWFIPRTENDLPGVNFQPKYDQTSSRAHSGSGAQRIWTDNATFSGGIYHVIRDVQVGAKVRFTIWGQVWSTNDESPISARPSHDIRLKIGVDPLGGNDGNPSPLNGQVVWSQEQEAKDDYTQFTVEVEAKSPTIIVYTYATMKDNVRHNEVFWDDASFEYIAPPPTATPANSITTTGQITPAEVASAVITPTIAAPAQTAALTHTVKQGDTLLGIALDQGVSLEDLLKNNPGVQAETLQIGQVLVVKSGNVAPTAEVAMAVTPAPGDVATLDPNLAGAIAETPTVTATPTFGQACVQAFFDDNGDGKKDDNEDLVPNIMFALSASGAQIGVYTTMGVDEPYCFDNLQNQAYTVAATVSDVYVPTTPLNDTLNVDGGKAEFSLGLRRASDGSKNMSKTPTVVAQATNTGDTTLGALSLGGGALLLVGAVGFVVSLFLRRRRL